FDIAYLRTLPGVVLAAPRDASDVERMLELGLKYDGPFFLRFPRDNCPGVERIHRSERREMTPGKAEELLQGGRVQIWGSGWVVGCALEAGERLRRQGIDAGVVDARFVKPLDVEMLSRAAQASRWIVTVEEHQRAGGFGSAVLEALNQIPNATARVRVLAVPDRFVEHKSSREEQLAEVGLDPDGIERTVRALLAPTHV